MNHFKVKPFIVLSFIIGASSASFSQEETFILNPTRNELNRKSDRASEVLLESVRTSDRAIPRDLMDRATCVAAIPNVIRAGIIFGAKMGTGLVSCRMMGRNGRSQWSNPSFIKIKGGSWGLQIGLDSNDLVLVFVNQNAARRFAQANVTLGADLSISAGPLGRSASAGSDYVLRSEIYSYSHSRGLFAGLALEGSLLTIDRKASKIIYGTDNPGDAYMILSSENTYRSSFVNTLSKIDR